eukprot:1595811-Rhodomonas_salina.3
MPFLTSPSDPLLAILPSVISRSHRVFLQREDTEISKLVNQLGSGDGDGFDLAVTESGRRLSISMDMPKKFAGFNTPRKL